MTASLLDPTSQAQSQAKFTYALPSPPVLDATGGGNYTIQANQVDNFFMGLVDPLTDLPLVHYGLFLSVASTEWDSWLRAACMGRRSLRRQAFRSMSRGSTICRETTCCRSTRVSFHLISRQEPSRSSRISMAVIPKQRAMVIPTPGSPRTTPRQGRPTKLRLTPMTTASKRPR